MDRQRSVLFWVSQLQSDHIHTMNERATGWYSQANISTILNSLMTSRLLTCYEWQNNRGEQTGKDQHYSEFSKDNQATYNLWMREEQIGKDLHYFAFSNENQTTYFLWMKKQQDQFQIPKLQSDNLLAMNKKPIGWNIEEKISTNLNSLMIIRALTCYEWEIKRVEHITRYQHPSGFPSDNQTTYSLWIREQEGRMDRQRSVLLWIPQW